MSTITTARDHTPWWVYLLLVILIQRGIKARRPSVMTIWKLAILPVIFLAMDVLAMVRTRWIDLAMIVMWIVFLIAGGWAGILLVRNVAIRVDRANWIIGLPGLAHPASRDHRVRAEIHDRLHWRVRSDVGELGPVHIASLVVGGFITGIFAGRFYAYLLKLFTAESEPLAIAGID